MTLPLDDLKAWIGREEEASDLVTPRLVEGFRATLAPHLAPVPAGEAPLALHWCLAPPAVPEAGLGPDGHPARGGFLPPVPLPRRMWAGGEIETLGPLRVGDHVRRRSVVADVAAKEGRTGALCFVTVRHGYLSERGTAIRERHDIVYRDPPQPGAAPPPGEPGPRGPDLVWSVPATSVLLFRYSALTFNGHRIHYDEPYVREVEGYDGLVVHGPLQATLMLNAAAVLGGGVPARFRYRGVRPMTHGQTFEVCAARQPDGSIAAWTRDAARRVCMEGQGTWG
jgi:3-methylfumaryl-CoA hydratase